MTYNVLMGTLNPTNSLTVPCPDDDDIVVMHCQPGWVAHSRSPCLTILVGQQDWHSACKKLGSSKP